MKSSGWRMYRRDANATGYAPDSESPTDFPLAVTWKTKTRNLPDTFPVPTPEGIAVLNWAEEITFLDSHGHVRWTFDGHGPVGSNANVYSMIHSPPAFDGGSIVAGFEYGMPANPDTDTEKQDMISGRVFSIDSKSGAVEWTFTVEGKFGFASAPVVRDGLIFICTKTGTLYVLDSDTGQKQWEFHPAIDPQSHYQVTQGLVVTENSVLMGLNRPNGRTVAQGRLIRIDRRTGTSTWATSTPWKICHSPAASDGVIYVGSGEEKTDGYIAAIDELNGETRWKTQIDRSIKAPLAVGPARVYGTTYSHVYALTKSTGDIEWSLELQDTYGGLSPPALGGPFVYVTDRDNVRAMNAKTGEEVWHGELVQPGSPRNPAIANNRVYVGTGKGWVCEFGSGDEGR